MSITSIFRDYFKVKNEISRLNQIQQKLQNGLELVFYAETANDWIYFEGLIFGYLAQWI